MLVVTRDVDSPVGCSYRMVAVGLDNLIKYFNFCVGCVFGERSVYVCITSRPV